MQGFRFLKVFAVVSLLAGLVLAGSGQGRAVLAQQGGPASLEPEASATSTAFTYQGQLKDGGALAQGAYRLKFSLWDAAQNGNQMGTSETESVTVNNGLFTATLNAAGQFGENAFSGDARWLQIRICPSNPQTDCVTVGTDLSPRQPLTGTPYALGLRPGTMIKGAAFQNLKVLSTAPTGGMPAGVTGEMTAAADGVGVYGSNSVQTQGATGVGVWGRSWSPKGAGVKGTGLNGADGVWGSNATGVAGRFETDSTITTPQVLLKENANDFARLSFANTATDKTWTIAGYPSATDANARLNLWYSPIGDVMSLTGSGKVGIGTSDPKQKLHVAGDTYAKGHVWLYAYEGDGSTGTAYVQARDDSGKSSIGMQLRTQNAGTITEAVRVTPNGNVGIGTTAPAAQLHVESSASGGLGLFVKPGPGGKAAKFAGNVQLTDASGAYLVMELGQGLDYAEAFDVTGLDRPIPGTVLVIDSEHPGQLAVSSSPYDSKVAGIVAGAGGTGSGVRLGVGQYDTDVALAGRVYCNVDAGTEAIQPGDLLTTSSATGLRHEGQRLRADGGHDPGQGHGAFGQGAERPDSGPGHAAVSCSERRVGHA